MATDTQLDIIAHLLNQEEPQTIRGIARALGRSYPLVYNAIQDLAKKEIIFKKKTPPAQIITINPHVRSTIFIDAEIKKSRAFLQTHKFVQVFLNQLLEKSISSFFSLLVFGSYAKGTYTAKSDIDLLFIVPKVEDKDPLSRAVKEIYMPVPKHVVAVTENDCLEMISKSKLFNVGNEAQKHHLILYGIENYYTLLRKSLQWAKII